MIGVSACPLLIAETLILYPNVKTSLRLTGVPGLGVGRTRRSSGNVHQRRLPAIVSANRPFPAAGTEGSARNWISGGRGEGGTGASAAAGEEVGAAAGRPATAGGGAMKPHNASAT